MEEIRKNNLYTEQEKYLKENNMTWCESLLQGVERKELCIRKEIIDEGESRK